MNLVWKFVAAAFVINLVDSAYYCDVFLSHSQGGIGCELEEEVIKAEEKNIVLSDFHPTKQASDIIWIEINSSNFSTSPKEIFEAFVNLKRVEINLSTGLATLDPPFFLERLEEIVVVGNDVQIIGEHDFKGLSVLKVLDLNNNAIKTIHAKAFKDLSELKVLNLTKNHIELIEDNTFSSNVNLEVIRIAHNKIKIIADYLFEGNTKLIFLDLHLNEINQIGRNFTNGLEFLERINLSSNECVDVNIEPVKDLNALLENCYKN